MISLSRTRLLQRVAGTGKLFLCGTLFLTLATSAGVALAAKKTHQATTTSKSKPRKAVRSKRRGTARAAAATAAVAGTAAVVASKAQAEGHPELLERCGFTQGARKRLYSRALYILDEKTGLPVYELNADIPVPIASISKLMTAIVWLDHPHEPMSTRLEVSEEDLDTLKFTQSRLSVGSKVTRADMLHIALMSSENRAAAALSRDYPGGREAFIAAMNAKAKQLAMPHTHFVNATGLSPENVSTARELTTLVRAANDYKLIRTYSIDKQETVNIGRGQLQYVNSNRLVRYGQIHASVQKTGFINEAGHNMVFRLMVHDRRPVIVTLLGSDSGDGSRRDGMQIAKWLSCSLQ